MSSQPPGPDPPEPVVEPSAKAEQTGFGQDALRLRIRQQELLAELGVGALKRTTFDDLLRTAVRIAAEGLQAELCKVLEFRPVENRLVMVAGVGWGAGLVGVVSVGADEESPSGFALRTGQPVISNHLEHEERFRTPELLKAHGVRRAINVILQGDGAPYGVLEVDSRSPGEFSEHDIAFLQGVANILGMAIERQRYERNLQDALEHHKVLIREINHRVKNSLQLVSSLFRLQAATAEHPKVVQSLQEAMGRVSAIAGIHERLYRSPDVGTIDLAAYLKDICADLAALAPQCGVDFESEGAVPMAPDRAVRVALLTTELVTNAAKHAGAGRIGVRLAGSAATPSAVTLTVRDCGPGLPDNLEISTGQTLGLKIIRCLVEQMGATVTTKSARSGGEVAIEIPRTEPLAAG